jgi:hypothetical protein
MIGSEAVMELVEELKEMAPTYLAQDRAIDLGLLGSKNNDDNNLDQREAKNADMLGRRWIWVHHIKDSDRRKTILSEARYLKLGGYLKSGYPGIIVIEGDVLACDEFCGVGQGQQEPARRIRSELGPPRSG